MKCLIIFSVIFLSSCTIEKKIIGKKYTSICINGIYPNVILLLKKDKTFEYKFAYVEEKVSGNWYIQKDTLFIKSQMFTDIVKSSMTPKIKVSNTDGFDSYLIKGRKLFIINDSNNLNKSCFLLMSR